MLSHVFPAASGDVLTRCRPQPGEVAHGEPAAVSLKFYRGNALNALDGKNRLSVPASFREVAEARAAEKAIILAPHRSQPCLIGYDNSYFARLETEIERRFGDDFGPERESFVQDAFGASEVFTYDETGRIALSASLKELGGLDRHAFFIGLGDHFLLWDPQAFLAANGAEGAVARQLAFHLKAKRA